MRTYPFFAPATDTTEIRSDLRGPYFERHTVELSVVDYPTSEIPFWEPRPTVTRYERRTLTDRLFALWLRVLSSSFADDVRAATRSAFWPAAFLGGFLMVLLILWITRGMFLTFNGWQPIPTGGVR